MGRTHRLPWKRADVVRSTQILHFTSVAENDRVSALHPVSATSSALDITGGLAFLATEGNDHADVELGKVRRSHVAAFQTA